MSILDRDIAPRFDRSRFANALAYVDETDTGVRTYEVELTIINDPGGAGVVTTYDLKRPGSLRHRVSFGASLLSGWTILEGTGPAESDQIDLDIATLPANGSAVRVIYDLEVEPRGEFFGRRTPIEIDADDDRLFIESTGDETLWHLTGRRDVYDDPSLWWALVDANDGLNGIFAAMLKPIKRGVVIEAPTEADILIQLEGLFEL